MRIAKCTTLLVITIMFTLITICLIISKGLTRYSTHAQRKPTADDLDGLVIAVKSTLKYHDSRLLDILNTWFRLAPDNIHFVTDTSDETLNATSGGKLIVSDCGNGHTREGLCCKMNAELELFLSNKPRWACHFDDDNYVNLAELVRVLAKFDHRRDWYLGRPSTIEPVTVEAAGRRVKFWFATGGAGFCLSQSLLMKMQPYVRDGGFEMLGDHLRLPDDVSLGYLIEHLLNVKLTVLEKFHSHLEDLEAIGYEDIREQISFSAGINGISKFSVVNVPVDYIVDNDRNHFRSLHCFLYHENCNR